MGYYTQDEIVTIVNRLIKKCGTRDPYRIAEELGINILYRDFKKQRGAYKVILKNRFIFLQNGLHPVIEQIVLRHEIGHDMLHRQEAEYSCAVTPQVRQTGNRLSGLAGTAYASLFT